MKTKFLIFLFIALSSKVFPQNSTDRVPISETYSFNGKFKLESVSYDDEFPNLKGKSVVSFTDKTSANAELKKYYDINRSFDLFESYPYFLAISNDGRKIIYIKDATYYKGEEHKEVTYYVDGKLQKTYTAEEFINCDRTQEKCAMFYNNHNQVYAGQNFKDGVSEEEKFLSKNVVFNKNDTIYVVDARKMVTIYDLNNDKFIGTKMDFDKMYPKLKDIKPVKSKVSYYKYPYKYIIDIESVKSGEKLSQTISKISKLKFIHINDSTFHKYKLNRISLTGYLNRGGKFEIESFDGDKIFDKEKIVAYLKNTVFKGDFIPQEVDRIYLKHFFGGYRDFNDKIAEQETLKAKQQAQEEAKKRLTLEKIDDIYIPKNIYECLTELDKVLNFEGKKQLLESKDASQFNSHMGGLGMWIRNNWGINGGSRLSKYFHDRKVGIGMWGNDTISGEIIDQYIKWLKGDKTASEKWEREHPQH
jgi:hypothetical protein